MDGGYHRLTRAARMLLGHASRSMPGAPTVSSAPRTRPARGPSSPPSPPRPPAPSNISTPRRSPPRLLPRRRAVAADDLSAGTCHRFPAGRLVAGSGGISPAAQSADHAFALPTSSIRSPLERQRRGPCQPGPTAQENPASGTAGLKARSKTLDGRPHADDAGFQPLSMGWTATWAAGPGWHDDGPLACGNSPVR